MTRRHRIAVVTDAHANLPALDAALTAIADERVDAVFHTGDAIAIGPYPAECLDRLLHTPNMNLVMGNHDACFARGLPDPVPGWMSAGEAEHQRWTHARIDPALRPVVAAWPYRSTEGMGRFVVAFQHYGLNPSGREFKEIVREPGATDLGGLFTERSASLVFYGHRHPRSDLVGRARYINPGALGCSVEPEARYALVEFERNGAYEVELRSVPYDWTTLFREMDRREMPERDVIRAAFFGQSKPV